MSPTKALTTRKPNRYAFEPQSTSELEAFCRWAITSGCAPTYLKDQLNTAMAIVMMGRALDVPALNALREFHCIRGEIAMSARLMSSLCQSHPDCENWAVEDGDGWAQVTAKRRGMTAYVSRFSEQDAKTAGLWGRGSWKTYPKDMLKNRAIARAARTVFPDAILGVAYTVEEVQDFEDFGDAVVEPAVPTETIKDRIARVAKTLGADRCREIAPNFRSLSHADQIAAIEKMEDEALKKVDPIEQAQVFLQKAATMAHRQPMTEDEMAEIRAREKREEGTGVSR